MKAKLLSTLAAGACLAMASAAWAGGPVALNDKQMDAVTAGGLVVGQGFSNAAADAGAWGIYNASEYTTTKTDVRLARQLIVTVAPPGVPDPTATFVWVVATSYSESAASAK